jgi:hypothetical protein
MGCKRLQDYGSVEQASEFLGLGRNTSDGNKEKRKKTHRFIVTVCLLIDEGEVFELPLSKIGAGFICVKFALVEKSIDDCKAGRSEGGTPLVHTLVGLNNSA